VSLCVIAADHERIALCGAIAATANYASEVFSGETTMQLIWLGIAIAATVGYHVVLKLTPAGANPYLSLAVTYAVVTMIFAAVYLVAPGPATFRHALGELNWTAPVLGVVVVFLDLGFFMLYRGGFDVSLGQLITQSAAALLLLLVGVAFFAEKLSAVNVGGILLCVVGLWLINKK
jgi:multidrug transporter EmrE-like cation transporter